MNLREAIDFYLNEPKAKSTVKTYTTLLNKLVTMVGPIREITDIGIVDIKTFEQWLHKQSYKPGTVSMYVRVIKACFKWLQEQELIVVSPARTLKAGKRSRREADTKAATLDEVVKMLDYARYDLRLYALIAFLAQSGARAGEAASLKLKDIDFESRRAWVTEKRKAGQKIASRREVIFGKVASLAIQEWLKKRDRGGMVNQQVFAKDGREYKSAKVTYIVGYVSIRCLPQGRRVTPHMLRHFFIHRLSLGGMSDSLITPLTGHTDASQIQFTYGPRDMLNAKSAAYPLIDKGFPMPAGYTPEESAKESVKIIAFPRIG